MSYDEWMQKQFEQGQVLTCDDGSEMVIVRPGRRRIVYEGREVIYKRHCPQCGAVFYTTNSRKHFCSESCHYPYVIQREKDRRAAAREIKASHLPMTCQVCGKALTNPAAKYCSPACRQKAYREKKKQRSSG